jgi:hypothetical protein
MTVGTHQVTFGDFGEESTHTDVALEQSRHPALLFPAYMIEVHHEPMEGLPTVRTGLGLQLADSVFLGLPRSSRTFDLFRVVFPIPLPLVGSDALFTESLQLPRRLVLDAELPHGEPQLTGSATMLSDVSRGAKTRPLSMAGVTACAAHLGSLRCKVARLLVVAFDSAKTALLSLHA